MCIDSGMVNDKAFDSCSEILNRPFAASHSRGTKPLSWRAKDAPGQDRQRKLPFKIMYVFCLSCPIATFALQRGGFVPREWLAAKGLSMVSLSFVLPRAHGFHVSCVWHVLFPVGLPL